MKLTAASGLDVTELDANEAGTIARGGNNSTAAYAAPDASGRGTFAFGGNHFVYYAVNAKVLWIVVTDANEPDLGSAYAGVSGRKSFRATTTARNSLTARTSLVRL